MTRLIKRLSKKRQGDLLAILLFAFMIGIVAIGTLVLAFTLYSSGEETALRYGDFQSYRSMAELAAYNYITDIETVVVTKDITGDWISQNHQMVFAEALESIVSSVGVSTVVGSAEELVWRVNTIEDAIGGTPTSDMTPIAMLLAKVKNVYNTFQLYLPIYPTIDYDSSVSVFADMTVPLQPLEVHVNIRVKGESLREVLYVDGLQLHVVTTTSTSPTGGYMTTITMQITEEATGLEIYRQ